MQTDFPMINHFGPTPLHQPPKLAYSVVIPLFNDGEILPALHQRVSAVMASLRQPYEIVYVDDGSRDNTFVALSKLHQTDPDHVKAVRLLRNFGQHPAVTAGFEQTTGQTIITLDSDLQNPPEEIPKLLAKLSEGYDVVVGWRQIRQDSVLRTWPSKFINWLISRSTGVKLHDYGSMLRVYRREIVQLLNQTQESAKFITALTSWLGANIIEVPVRHETAADGQSRYRLRRLFRMTIDLATGYSLVPIQLVTGLGLAMSIIGVSAGLFLLAYRIIFGVNVTGLSSFIALLLVLFGIQLAGLGIIGEYIGRIYIEVRSRPYYLIRTILHHNQTPVVPPEKPLIRQFSQQEM
ncbi:MAG: Undecaprenyl-phosphate 4-deoxy-4-formamido-L-arabinose transferase [Anaerolineae bacterium]|nr:Undecaprenyl-phosphate 4-deoxy-4-formamido-L-arabinose transferase [Anaerolineae bacterium]